MAVYGAGVLLALWRTDADWALRILLALLWPLGPVAFGVTISILIAASLIAFPVIGLLVAAGLLAWWAL